ncbi:MAG: hypothetical protein RL291_726, partial [Pseudomonadota bacterium]
TPSGRSIQAKGIDPDIVVENELPDELKPRVAAERPRGEASLRGHLSGDPAKKEQKEESGSSSYVPPDPAKDTQLQIAFKIARGEPYELPKKPDAPAAPAPAPEKKQ